MSKINYLFTLSHSNYQIFLPNLDFKSNNETTLSNLYLNFPAKTLQLIVYLRSQIKSCNFPAETSLRIIYLHS